MRVCCIALDCQAQDWNANLSQALEGIRRAAAEGAELCVLPEMWPTSFCAEFTPEAQAFTGQALEQVALLTGELGIFVAGSAYGPVIEGRPTNRMHLHGDGELVWMYDKGHLFSPTAEHLSFAPGPEPPAAVETRLGKLAGIVCYDLRFPRWVRPSILQGAQVLLVCAQWPEARTSHWRALVLGRAVEGQCFVVACNRSGTTLVGRRQLELTFPSSSLIVDPEGNILAEGNPDTPIIHAALDLEKVSEQRRLLPVQKDERLPGSPT
ncbi:MAG: carbon-nitrogen family hydrolase [Planctomycetes bacterium]|nr:carbon-nitrogen family hydrolase [Planctomycetota bacterium]